MAVNSNFNMVTNVLLDTKQAEQQLKNFTKTREITTAIKIRNPETDNVEQALKKVKTLVDNFGNKVKQTDIINLNGEKIKSDVNNISESFKALNHVTTEYKNGLREIASETENSVEKLGNFNANVTKITKTYTDAAGEQQKVIETTSKWVDENNKLHTSISTMDDMGNKLAPTIHEVANAEEDVSEKTKGLIDNFALANVKARLIQEAFNLMRDAARLALQTITEFDNALIEFQKVSDLSGKSLQNYVNNLADVGKLTGSTVQSMVEAATEFKKSGYSDADSATLASIAEIKCRFQDKIG